MLKNMPSQPADQNCTNLGSIPRAARTQMQRQKNELSARFCIWARLTIEVTSHVTYASTDIQH